MVHLEHATPASRAMMCAIRFSRLAFLAETGLARGFYSERLSVLVRRWLVGRKMRVARFVTDFERRAWIGEDSGRV